MTRIDAKPGSSEINLSTTSIRARTSGSAINGPRISNQAARPNKSIPGGPEAIDQRSRKPLGPGVAGKHGLRTHAVEPHVTVLLPGNLSQ